MTKTNRNDKDECMGKKSVNHGFWNSIKNNLWFTVYDFLGFCTFCSGKRIYIFYLNKKITQWTKCHKSLYFILIKLFIVYLNTFPHIFLRMTLKLINTVYACCLEQQLFHIIFFLSQYYYFLICWFVIQLLMVINFWPLCMSHLIIHRFKISSLLDGWKIFEFNLY